MALFEYRPQWSVPGAGSAESIFRVSGLSSDLDGAVSAVRSFFGTLADNIPNDVSISFPAEAYEINAVTGELEDIITVIPGDTVNGSYSGAWAGGVGVVFKWDTGVVLGGRRLRGRTFLVPSAQNIFDNDGTLASGVPAALAAVGTTLIGALNTNETPLVILSKTHGDWSTVSTCSVPDRSAILRSRRD